MRFTKLLAAAEELGVKAATALVPPVVLVIVPNFGIAQGIPVGLVMKVIIFVYWFHT